MRLRYARVGNAEGCYSCGLQLHSTVKDVVAFLATVKPTLTKKDITAACKRAREGEDVEL